MAASRQLILLALSLAAQLLTGCSDTTAPVEDTAPVARIVLTSWTNFLHPGATLQLYATVYDSSDRVLAGRSLQWFSSSPMNASVSPTGLVTALAPVAGVIRAVSGATTGYFRVYVEYAECTDSTPTEALVIGATHSGTLAGVECGYPHGWMRADGWSFSVPSLTAIRATVHPAFGTIGATITDGMLGYVSTGASHAAGGAARVVAYLRPGSYRVWVQSADLGAREYTLSTVTATACDPSTASGAIAVGDSVSGAISATSCVLPSQIEGQGWRFSLESNSTVRFSVPMSAFLPWIEIRNAEMDYLGGGANSFEVALPAGDYFVGVRGIGGERGSFVLARNN